MITSSAFSVCHRRGRAAGPDPRRIGDEVKDLHWLDHRHHRAGGDVALSTLGGQNVSRGVRTDRRVPLALTVPRPLIVTSGRPRPPVNRDCSVGDFGRSRREADDSRAWATRSWLRP
jgi:hypothetical protein